MAQTLGDYQMKESLLLSQNGELHSKVLLMETNQKHDKQKVCEMRREEKKRRALSEDIARR